MLPKFFQDYFFVTRLSKFLSSKQGKMLPKFFQESPNFRRITFEKFGQIFPCHDKTGESRMLPKFFQDYFFVTFRLDPNFCRSKPWGKCCPNFSKKIFGDSTFQIFVIKTGENAAQIFPRAIFFCDSTFQIFVIKTRGKCCPNFSKQNFGSIRLSKCFVIKTGENAAQIFPRLFFGDSTFWAAFASF